MAVLNALPTSLPVNVFFLTGIMLGRCDGHHQMDLHVTCCYLTQQKYAARTLIQLLKVLNELPTALSVNVFFFNGNTVGARRRTLSNGLTCDPLLLNAANKYAARTLVQPMIVLNALPTSFPVDILFLTGRMLGSRRRTPSNERTDDSMLLNADKVRCQKANPTFSIEQ